MGLIGWTDEGLPFGTITERSAPSPTYHLTILLKGLHLVAPARLWIAVLTEIWEKTDAGDCAPRPHAHSPICSPSKLI